MLSFIFSIIITFLLLSTLVALFNPKKFQFLKDLYDKKNSAITRIDVFLISTVLLIPLIIIAGMVGSNSNHSDISHTIPAVEYSIISNEKMNVGVGGLGDISRITVELPKRISKQQLEKIAYTIKDDSPTERNLIFYVIKGETHIGVWATTHFDTPSTNDENGNVIYSIFILF